MFAALWLAEQGKQVTLLSPADDLGVDTNDPERGHLAELLAAELRVRWAAGWRRPARSRAFTPRRWPFRWSPVAARSWPHSSSASAARATSCT